MAKTDLERLFYPRALALIGASDNYRKWGYNYLFNILKGNYRGRVYPVNPQKESILGVTCYPTVGDIPGQVDLALITTPAATVPALVEDCGCKGIPFIIVVTSDFSETGPKGAELERQVRASAERHGIRIIGPNTMGIFSAEVSLHAVMPQELPLHGPVSMFSQSGNLGTQMLGWGISEGVGFNKFISSGNESDLSSLDFLEYYGRDEKTRVVVAYLEGLSPETGFVSVARAVSTRKPLIVIKGGRTSAGQRAASSHTGAMATPLGIFQGACRQSGVIEAASTQALMDCAKAFSNLPLPAGNRIGIITRGGGWGVMAADMCEESGLEVPPLPPSVLSRLDELLPRYWSRGNPIDLVAPIGVDPYIGCLEILAGWEGVDAVLALGISIRSSALEYSKELNGPDELLAAIAKLDGLIKAARQKPDKNLAAIKPLMDHTGKPIVSVETGPDTLHRAYLETYGIVSFPTPERAVATTSEMVRYRNFKISRISNEG